MKKGELLFVYGTLRKGERADLSRKTMLDNQYLGTDEINARMYHIGAFPGVKLCPEVPFNEWHSDAPRVIGDVFLINDPSTAAVLDSYEGYNEDDPESGHYNRCQLVTKKGRVVWVYTYNPYVRDEQFIETGDWKNPRLQVTRRIPKVNL